jgi:hypothetical protein
MLNKYYLFQMNVKQIERIEQLEESLRVELEANLDAIHLVKKLLKERDGKSHTIRLKHGQAFILNIPVPESPKSSRVNKSSAANGTFESKVLSVISKTEGEFGLADIKKKLTEIYPNEDFNRNSLSGVIFRNKGKKVQVVKEGRGRRSAVYRRIIAD